MYLNTTVNEKYRKEWESLMDSEMVEVSVNAYKIGSFIIPISMDEDIESDIELKAKFKVMNCKEYWDIEQSCTSLIDEGRVERKEIDYQQMRIEMLQRMLVSWNLDILIKRNESDNKLTESCFNEIKRVNSPIISGLLLKYEETINLDEDEVDKIERQATVLFGKNSRGVENACEAVSMYCVLTSFWDKFGLTKFDMVKLPFKEYMMMRVMLGKESEAMAVESGSAKGHQRAGQFTSIAGQGGKIRKDTGQQVRIA